MSTPTAHPFNRRRHERFTLPPMYTAVTVQRVLRDRGLAIQTLEGHAYDVSESGIRLELDEPLDIGEQVRITIDLPGGGGSVTVWAEVVRVFDEVDDPAARRMALAIREYATPADHARLISRLGLGTLRRAA